MSRNKHPHIPQNKKCNRKMIKISSRININHCVSKVVSIPIKIKSKLRIIKLEDQPNQIQSNSSKIHRLKTKV